MRGEALRRGGAVRKVGANFMDKLKIVCVRGEHYEVFVGGRFQFSADTLAEVYEELDCDELN